MNDRSVTDRQQLERAIAAQEDLRGVVPDEIVDAAVLIGLVQRQPAFDRSNESEIGRILGRSGLPADVIEQGLARGVDQDFNAVVDRFTQELTNGP